jgi:hypothetical protein
MNHKLSLTSRNMRGLFTGIIIGLLISFALSAYMLKTLIWGDSFTDSARNAYESFLFIRDPEGTKWDDFEYIKNFFSDSITLRRKLSFQEMPENQILDAYYPQLLSQRNFQNAYLDYDNKLVRFEYRSKRNIGAVRAMGNSYCQIDIHSS